MSKKCKPSSPDESTRTCEGCGEPYQRRRTETRRQFVARRFCSRSCSVRRERPEKRAPKRQPELVRCAECEGLFEATPSRIARSRSGLLYCSRECQAAHRKRGGALHVQPDGPLRLAVAADARTGLYSLRALAERHGCPVSTIGVILHREGIRLREVRHARSPHPLPDDAPAEPTPHPGAAHDLRTAAAHPLHTGRL